MIIRKLTMKICLVRSYMCLPHRKLIKNHCVHFNGEIGPSTIFTQSSSHHNNFGLQSDKVHFKA